MPGHVVIARNEMADQLARQGSSHALTLTEPSLGTFANIARGVTMGWTSRKHKECWQPIREQRQAKGSLNLVKTKRNLLFIRNQSVPRSKHFPPRL